MQRKCFGFLNPKRNSLHISEKATTFANESNNFILLNLKTRIMRKATLAVCLCLSACAFAVGTGSGQNQKVSLVQRITKSQAKPYSSAMYAPKASLAEEIVKRMNSQAAEKPSSYLQLGQLMSQAELRKMAVEAQQKKQKLDSVVCTTHSTGAKVSLQTFTYYDNSLPKERINSLWNDQTKKYQEIEKNGYTWDKDGYCLVQYSYSNVNNSGQKIEYTYNDRKLGISQIISNYVNGTWVPYLKGEYEYDENGNIIEEFTYIYENGAWLNATWNKVSWDDSGRKTSIESHYWTGTEWDYSQDRKEYAYDANGNQTLWAFYKYDLDKKDWYNYYRVEQTFNEKSLLTRQENKFWNKDTQTWAGVYDWGFGLCYNSYTDLTYDELYRLKLERAMFSYEIGKYIKTCDYVYEYTPTEEGGYERVEKALLYEPDGETSFLDGLVTKRFDMNGKLIFKTEKQKNGDIMPTLYDEFYTYDNDGFLTGSKFYKYDKDAANKRYADIAETIIYDKNHNIVDSYYAIGQGTGEEDWLNTTRFTYKYEQDTVRTEKMGYRWDGSEYVPNFGDGIVFDYTVPVEDLALWIGGTPYHKINETMSYTANGNEWDWQSFKYFYSDVKTTGISDNLATKGISISPRVVTDRLSITSDGDVNVKIFSANGSLAATATEKEIDLGNLPRGMYIVDVNGYKAKIVKK